MHYGEERDLRIGKELEISEGKHHQERVSQEEGVPTAPNGEGFTEGRVILEYWRQKKGNRTGGRWGVKESGGGGSSEGKRIKQEGHRSKRSWGRIWVLLQSRGASVQKGEEGREFSKKRKKEEDAPYRPNKVN